MLLRQSDAKGMGGMGGRGKRCSCLVVIRYSMF